MFFEIGDEVVVVDPRLNKRWGKVVGFDGDEFAGMYPRVIVRTPGGSNANVGVVFVRRAAEEDLVKLREFERMHEELMATYPPEKQTPLYASPEEGGAALPPSILT